MDEKKFCKDCKYVGEFNDSTPEDEIECLYFPKLRSSYISPVTGKKVELPAIKYWCKHERDLGGCAYAQYFEEKRK
jgi:hypothetical protein